ncbi:hypothetical protein COLO4_23676 [Corchorus olitorius]|uniref:Uncharacterized protein n=1 Tax=Corchorus olitorius TaxID=93759 RepID=A0A1R3IFE4_9ROSI|nr:hypothetical protein COLO4_23676 [Corchorus olitorius]
MKLESLCSTCEVCEVARKLPSVVVCMECVCSDDGGVLLARSKTREKKMGSESCYVAGRERIERKNSLEDFVRSS